MLDEFKLDKDILAILKAANRPMYIEEIEECLMDKLIPYLHKTRSNRIRRSLKRLLFLSRVGKLGQNPARWVFRLDINNVIQHIWRPSNVR